MQASLHKGSRLTTILVPLAAIISIADGVLKWVALSTHTVTEPFSSIVPGVLAFGLHQNRGAIANIPLGQPLILTVSLALIACLILLAYRHRRDSQMESATIVWVILLGAVNNFADRALHGFTTDYLLLGPWSIVNLSDGLIFAGILWLGLRELRASVAA
jgi:lipoprotein signal peptidase